VWRADKPFYARFREEVDEVQHALLLRAAKLHLLAAKRAEARAHLKRASTIGGDQPSLKERALRAAAAVPGSGVLLFAARAALHGARQLMDRQ